MGGFGAVAAEGEGLNLGEEDGVFGAGGGVGEDGEGEEEGVGEMHVGWPP